MDLLFNLLANKECLKSPPVACEKDGGLKVGFSVITFKLSTLLWGCGENVDLTTGEMVLRASRYVIASADGSCL